MSETIYILLPVHNRRDITKRFINCLSAQTYGQYHLVLIDDGSTDGTAEMVRDLIPAVTVLQGKGDWWWAGSLQQGYLWLREQNPTRDSIVLIINDDTVFEPDFLEKGGDLLSGRERVLLLAQYYSLQDGRLIDCGIHLDWSKLLYHQSDKQEHINCLSTRGLFLRFSDFTELGGFFKHFLPHYFSDYEFTIRAYRKGFNLTTDSSLKLWGDELTTGDHVVNVEKILPALKMLFSKKSSLNPAYMSVYILLACPYRWIPLNLLRVWYPTFCLLSNILKQEIRNVLGVA